MGKEFLFIYLDVIMHKGWNLPFWWPKAGSCVLRKVRPKNQNIHGRMGYCALKLFSFPMVWF